MFEAIKKIFAGNGLRAITSSTMQGRKPSQEDSFLVTEQHNGRRLVFVADGVGGHGHGDWASMATVEVFSKAFDAMEPGADAAVFLHDTAMEAARIVLQKGIDQPEFKNCGTTVSGFLLHGNTYHTINIGDSRVYLWSKDILCRETHDHSIVQEMLDRGEITEVEAFSHPRRNMMTSAIGQSLDMIKIEINGPRTLEDGDLLMAFSDGVHDALTDEQIYTLVKRYKDSDDLADRLVQAAYNAGGKDNITAVIYRFSR